MNPIQNLIAHAELLSVHSDVNTTVRTYWLDGYIIKIEQPTRPDDAEVEGVNASQLLDEYKDLRAATETARHGIEYWHGLSQSRSKSWLEGLRKAKKRMVEIAAILWL